MVTYYKVGGCVRDEILGVRNKDIDFAVEAASYEEMKDDILSKGMIIFQERPQFFSIRGRHLEYGGVDFTLCRKEGFYSDNRHPDNVEIGTIYDDLARRDFTVNAIAKTEDGRYIDPHGGIDDLKMMFLRAVGDAESRFEEDPLRLLRAIRFHIVRGFILDFEIDYLTYSSIMPPGFYNLPLERVYEELVKCFVYDSWATLEFFSERPRLKRAIFKDMELGLIPRIPTSILLPS